ncbi:RIIa domain-containing protein 1-like isoform X4 [Hydra vulgaris]|uniref:RIIa domain-containing protein 1-like isoform X4 n=1 Tax=Hydra vulgaris TaxID=6087 RepID=A0ABM4DEW1_HYDVU
MADLKGCEKNDPEALTNEQQIKLDSFKIKTRISNENYLRSHPEIDCLLTNFISEICKQKPNNVREYAAEYFSDPNLPLKINAFLQRK